MFLSVFMVEFPLDRVAERRPAWLDRVHAAWVRLALLTCCNAIPLSDQTSFQMPMDWDFADWSEAAKFRNALHAQLVDPV